MFWVLFCCLLICCSFSEFGWFDCLGLFVIVNIVSTSALLIVLIVLWFAAGITFGAYLFIVVCC